MKIERPKKSQPFIPLASMGDIAFLLIIFFVLTSNFMKESHLDLTPPSAADIDLLESTPVSVAVDKDGRVWLQGEECPAELIENSIEALLDDKKDKLVLLKVDKDVPHEKYGGIVLSLSKAGADIAMVGQKQD